MFVDDLLPFLGCSQADLPAFPYSIDYSCLFDGSTDYLSYTPAVAGNRRVGTFKFRFKLVGTAIQNIFAAGPATNNTEARLYHNGEQFTFTQWNGASSDFVIQFDTEKFADPTAWYDCCLSWDTTQAVAADRVTLTVNGTELTQNVTTALTQNLDLYINHTNPHYIGRRTYDTAPWWMSAYLADVYLIDGTEYPASTWNENSSLVTGLWVPKDPGTLTYGTNGAYLDFSNSGALGTDSSGEGNNWTVGGTPAQSVDTPTNNACVLNALDPNAGTLSNGNLTLATGTAKPTLQPESGKWSYKKGGVEQLYDADVSGKFEPDLAADTYIFTGYTPTSGYSLITAENLPEPSIRKSSTVVDLVSRAGTGAEAAISSLDFQPDFVNSKDRDNVRSWALADAENLATKYLATDTTAALATDAQSLKSFDSAGYTLGTSSVMNHSGANFIDLCLKAGASQGFYQEAGISHTSGAATTITHGLGAAITFGLIKRTDSTGEWYIFHTDLGTGKYLLFTTAAAVTSAGFWSTNTSTTFDIPSGLVTGTYVAYLFTDSDIFKAFSYTGNASTDGPFVNLGGKVMAVPFLKNSSVAGIWIEHDNVRNPANPIDLILRPDDSGAEYVAESGNFTSQGLKITIGDSARNGSGNLIVGLAILESTKYTNAF